MRHPITAHVRIGQPRNPWLAIWAMLLAAQLAEPAAAQFDASAPEPIPRTRGGLFFVGAEYEAYREHFLAKVGASEARVIVLLPPDAIDPGAILAPWRELEAHSVRGLRATDREGANSDLLVEPLRAATGVWIEDGDATRIAEIYAGTAIEEELHAVLARGGMVGARGDAARALTAMPLGDGPTGLSEGAGLDLLPGALFEPELPADGKRSARLEAAMRSLPMFVGVGVRPTGSFILRERWIAGPRAWAWVSPADGRPLRTVTLGPSLRNGRSDLISLSRSASARQLRPFPVTAPPPPRVAQGTLLLAGGGALPAEVFERFIAAAGGVDQPIVYIPCAYEETIEEEPGFVRVLEAHGAQRVSWIHTKDRSRADADEQLLGALRKARGIWFGGGRQWNFVDSYQHTEAHRLMHAVLARGGVIAGSSAGASIQSDYMARGDPLGNRDIMAEGYEEGLGFLTGVAVDQHFTQRGRMPDLQSLVRTWPQYLGIGLDEGSVLLVRGSIGEVLGANVHILDARGMGSGENAAPVHTLLRPGERYQLAERKKIESR